jgi:hypothetical protein
MKIFEINLDNYTILFFNFSIFYLHFNTKMFNDLRLGLDNINIFIYRLSFLSYFLFTENYSTI